MLAKDLPKLWPVLHQLWKIEPNDELGRMIVGYERRDPETHEVVKRKRGFLHEFSVTEICDACRDWAIDNPGADPRAYQGKGWKQIKHSLSQSTSRSADDWKAREEAMLEEHRKHYAGWPEWEYPGDEYIRMCIRHRRPTPLQKHVFGLYREMSRKLAEKLAVAR